jgi:segregation and condensation protein B
MDDLKNIIESLLFVADEPLSIDRFKNIVGQAQTKEIREALEELGADYEARQGGFYLNEVAGGYQIRTRSEYMQWIKRLLQPKPSRLSKAALETLAIIAYKQPVIRSDVEHIRGVDCGGVLRVLLERKFIRLRWCAAGALGAKIHSGAGSQGNSGTTADLCHHQTLFRGI